MSRTSSLNTAAASSIGKTITYQNPVWPHYFADPFVLRVGRTYWAYGTAPASADGTEFPVLRSEDLATWKHVGHALRPRPDARGHNFWAPEVAEKDGRFYLFYSSSPKNNDEHHRIRVAIADSPQGPFEDAGDALMPDAGFSIDAHPFRDPRTGRWYLFFATDYTGEEPFGTGLAVAPLADDLLSVTAPPRIVIRASCDWQVYERQRNYKGRVWDAWHCVEGPFVLHHDDRYFCLYSGGAWHSENYGIGFATATDPLGPWLDDMARHGPTVLKGAAPKVIGPGHNSVVLGPDDRTLFCIYHAWDQGHTARRMCIDPLIWTADGPKCDGPSTEPRTIVL
jgi:arabinan endo-1,5-alpha-L-arabinosidase